MDILITLGTVWVAAAAAVTFGLGRAAAEGDREWAAAEQHPVSH